MIFDPANAIQLAWVVFIAYWLFASMGVNRMERREPAGSMIGRVAVMIGAYWLLFQQDPGLGVLNDRMFPFDQRIFMAGVILTWSGVAFAIWARYHLGKFWSATVALRESHQLIRTGPYAHVRHPIYTGMLTAILGSALAVGRYRALVAFLARLAAFVVKSLQEEKLLESQFGAEFEEHRRRTGFFLPRFS